MSKCYTCRNYNRCPWGWEKEFREEKCTYFEENPDLLKGRFLCVRCGKRHKRSGTTYKHGVGVISDERIEKRFKKEWENGSDTELCKKCTDAVLDFICNWKE